MFENYKHYQPIQTTTLSTFYKLKQGVKQDVVLLALNTNLTKVVSVYETLVSRGFKKYIFILCVK